MQGVWDIPEDQIFPGGGRAFTWEVGVGVGAVGGMRDGCGCGRGGQEAGDGHALTWEVRVVAVGGEWEWQERSGSR